MKRRSFLTSIFGSAALLAGKSANSEKPERVKIDLGCGPSLGVTRHDSLSVYKVWIDGPSVYRHKAWVVADSKLDAANLFAKMFDYKDKDHLCDHAKCMVLVGHMDQGSYLPMPVHGMGPILSWETRGYEELLKEGRGVLPAPPEHGDIDTSIFVTGYSNQPLRPVYAKETV